MIYAKKIRLIVTEEQSRILDGQSKICNWLYNNLLQQVNDDYENNNSERKLLTGRNLRDQVPTMKDKYPFIKSVYSVPVKNTAMRLKDAFDRFFKDKTKETGHPKFRSWKKKWFSLFYDEPYVGYKINGHDMLLSLGKDDNGKQIKIKVQLVEQLKIKDDRKLKNMRVVKNNNKFYAVFSIEKQIVPPDMSDQKRWIVFDPNHKNMMVGIDHTGKTIEFSKLTLVKYWDDKIDKLKSKRDKCKRKTRRFATYEGSNRYYFRNSRRWHKYDKALSKAYSARREQIKQALHSVAQMLARDYDLVVVGDYVPTTETAKYKNQHRSMLNQTFIGSLRKTLDWVMKKSNKIFYIVDEYHTTKECPFCGYMEHKDPKVRSYKCPECGTEYYRDIGSAINMAVKEKLLLRSDYIGWYVEQPMYTASWCYKRCKWLITKEHVADEGRNRDGDLVLSCA